MRNLLVFAAIVAAGFYFLSAGHLTMIAALLLMILVHEFGHWVVARSLGFEVQTFSIGFGSSPRIRLGKLWGTEFQITPWLAGGFVSINPQDGAFAAAPAWKRISVLIAGVVMNVISAALILFLVFASLGRQERVEKADTVQIRALAADVTVAADAGLQAGDRIVAVDGKAVGTVNDFISAVSAAAGREIAVEIERSGQRRLFTLTPNDQGRIGVMLQADFSIVYHKMSLGEAAGQAATGTINGVTGIGKGILIMLGVLEAPPGLPDGAMDVRGIVAIVQLGDMAWSNGLYSFLMIVVMVSFNLAVFNLLPIPMLDGGHIVFVVIEKLIGRPVPVALQNILSLMALAFLLSLFALGLFNDIFKPLKLK